MWDSTSTWAELRAQTALAADRAYEARDACTRLIEQTSWDSPAGRQLVQRVEALRGAAELLAQRIDGVHGAAVAGAARADAERSQRTGQGPAGYGSKAGWG